MQSLAQDRPPLGIPDAPEHLPVGRRDCALIRYAETVRVELEAATAMLYRLETALRYGFYTDSRDTLADACRDTQERARTRQREALAAMQAEWQRWEPTPYVEALDLEEAFDLDEEMSRG